MELLTRSYDKNWNRMVYLKVLEDQTAICSIKDMKNDKLILVLEGNGFIQCNHEELFITAPAVLCFNHNDTIVWNETLSLKAVVLFFQPIALNDQLKDNVFHPQFHQSIVGTTLYQDLTLLSSFYDINGSKRLLTILDSASSVIIKQLLFKIQQELTQQVDGYWPCRSRSFFIELLFFLEGLRHNESTQSTKVVINKNKNLLVHNIILYLNQNIDKKITLGELEKEFACNRNQINIEFQKELNTTVMKYFIQMRMQLASVILRDTEIPILEVALKVGYSDASYFSRTFKLYYGKSPSEYQSFKR